MNIGHVIEVWSLSLQAHPVLPEPIGAAHQEAERQQDRSSNGRSGQDSPTALQNHDQRHQDKQVRLDGAQTERHSRPEIQLPSRENHRQASEEQQQTSILPILQHRVEGNRETGKSNQLPAGGNKQPKKPKKAQQVDRLEQEVGGTIGQPTQWTK